MTPVPLPPTVHHASHCAYSRYKCRCEACKTFMRSYRKDRRLAGALANLKVWRGTRHGTYYAYRWLRCRCLPCKTHNAKVRAARKLKLRAKGMPATMNHGTYQAYAVYKCRCDPCLTYKREANHKNYLSKKARGIKDAK